MLSAMRYKTFTWPHNPRIYSISFERAIAEHKLPMGSYRLQDLGRRSREMRGEGEFFGPDAYRTFQALACLFYENTPGTLIHPLWQTASAYLTELKLEQEPRADYVRYSFAFREAEDTAGREAQDAYPEDETWQVIAEDDTALSIAARWGITMDELAALNPGVGSWSLVSTGEKVRVR